MRHTEFPEATKDLAGKARKHFQYEMFVKAYLRCIAGVDESVGRVLDFLDASGLRQNTIVVYTSDQGVFTGEHGLFDKRFMYEESLRMPLLVRYPRMARHGSASQEMVLNIDFAPTLLDLAGAPVPRDMQGASFRPLLGGQKPRQWRKSMYYRYWMHLAHFHIPAHYGVRTQRHKLIHYYGRSCGAKGAIDQATTPEWELFDLEKDPHERKNVYAVAAYDQTVKTLKAELARLRRQYGDANDCS
jgi:arylsulfatase A-like enzyme